MTPSIIVHGGAGAWDLTGERLVMGMEACRDAAALGQTILLNDGTALDAIEKAVNWLEDCPVLDAGRGSYLNSEGNVEMDAMIMDGATLGLGAVAAVQLVRYPVSLARRVMTDTEHTLLVADGASAFADRIGFPRCSLEELLVGDELARYLALKQEAQYATSTIFTEAGAMGDTVGAVAIDQWGNIAAATSTGGTRKKLPGRVGDSPLVGSGAYADNWTAGVSATGYGEKLMKILISKRVCDFVATGLAAKAACEAAIRVLEERVNGQGGLIAIDARGQIGWHFNTDAMPYAYIVGDGEPVCGR